MVPKWIVKNISQTLIFPPPFLANKHWATIIISYKNLLLEVGNWTLSNLVMIPNSLSGANFELEIVYINLHISKLLLGNLMH